MPGFPMAIVFAGFHLVLSDGHNQLQGQTKHVAEEVVEIFHAMGVDVTWSMDPSDPLLKSLPASRTVTVAVVPHSSRDWRIDDGVMATVARDERDAKGSVFLFYPNVARALDFRPARTTSILDGRPSGVPWQVGVARVVTHEILHYFLPGRPHDMTGIFMEHQRGDLLLSPKLGVGPETQEALLARLRELSEDVR